MTLLDSIWIIVSIGICFIILATDPKSSISGTSNTQLSTIFASASDSQKFIKRLNWVLIAAFFILTLSRSSFS